MSNELTSENEDKQRLSLLGQFYRLAESGTSVARQQLAASCVTAIRQVSTAGDREMILQWLLECRAILQRGGTTAEKASSLYQTMSLRGTRGMISSTITTAARSYQTSSMPLALKVAMPVTALGVTMLGMQGAGIVAMGGGIGLPVVVLIFLGVAGITSVVEAFVNDKSVRDPLTKLLLAFVAMEAARRSRKELLDALRADAMVPKKAPLPEALAEIQMALLAMDPVDFERHVMSFFEIDGHPVGITPRSNDFGVDGYVLHPDGVIAVQCKRYALDNPVGRPAIQQMKGVVEEQKALRAYIVTTSRFTNEAIESAAKSSKIKLIDGETLLTWHQVPPVNF